jgi:hypothetical protein
MAQLTQCIHAFLVVCVLGCGPAALPAPTLSPVSEAELLGKWSYTGAYGKAPITIEFLADHTFAQTVNVSSTDVRVQRGTWALRGANVVLTGVLMNLNERAWAPDHASWWFTDESGRRKLYGGENPDPDSCGPLTFVGPPAKP